MSIEEKSRLFIELLEKRKKQFAALRAQEKRIKPPSKEQNRNTVSTYLKNMAGYKHNQLKSKSYDEIQEMFDKEMKRVNTFVDMNTELTKSSETRIEGSSKRAWDELEFDNSKKQKIDENLKIQKMNIKFKGGLLGLKDFKMILRVTTAQEVNKARDFVMSDSEHSTVTYTEISSEFEDLSDIESPGGIVHGYHGLPMMPEDPYAYVEAAMQEPPPPDFVPESVYPEFMPPKDDVLLAEEKPLPTAVSPIADSLGYITESDEDPKEEDDEDPEEDLADYSTDRDDKEDEEESSGEDADDEEEDEDEDEEST
ncbi:hypothetical protein Tco_0383004 [Tanacetum coccineum]